MLTFLKSLFSTAQRNQTASDPEWTDQAWDEKEYAAELESAFFSSPDNDDHAAHFPGSDDTFSNDIFSDMSQDFNSPSFNIDGSPMMGDFDIHGNVYGVSSDDSFGSSNDY